jgi:cell division protein FtsI (penicillin-binding protein 3)
VKGGGRTAAYNAAITTAAIIRRSAALLGVKPRTEESAPALLASN